jgi:hypothetical protein
MNDTLKRTANAFNIARSALGVFAGIAVVMIIGFGIELPLKAFILAQFSASFPTHNDLDTNWLWKLSQIVYMVPAEILGGYVAAMIGRRLSTAVAMAVIMDLLLVMMIFNPPHEVPMWYWVSGLVVGPIVIIYGGYLWWRRRRY